MTFEKLYLHRGRVTVKRPSIEINGCQPFDTHVIGASESGSEDELTEILKSQLYSDFT